MQNKKPTPSCRLFPRYNPSRRRPRFPPYRFLLYRSHPLSTTSVALGNLVFLRSRSRCGTSPALSLWAMRRCFFRRAMFCYRVSCARLPRVGATQRYNGLSCTPCKHTARNQPLGATSKPRTYICHSMRVEFCLIKLLSHSNTRQGTMRNLPGSHERDEGT